ncbi:MAG: 50S ribosomal protein L13 [bacterium]|nr:50S ribosomal protein L13 [bacterium]
MPKGNRATHEINASGEVVGRLATKIATLLIGKHKATYRPNIDAGDNVVVSNVGNVVFTGKKWEDKKYYRTSNRPGGLKTTTTKELKETNPGFVLKHAVKYMLPKNKLQKDRLKRLTIK